MSNAGSEVDSLPRCSHCQFGLIVTGEGERQFLPQLFSALMSRADCSFKILRKIDQRPPITARRQLKMTGRGGVILPKDELEIGLEARFYLRNQGCHFIILVDDVEHARREQLPAIWQRYRTAMDTMLSPTERQRASVHFFANMLEAYYFADSTAVNAALGVPLLASDYDGDVEAIRHPKGDIESLAKAAGISFNEPRDGKKILPALDLDHILSRHETCAFLRAMFAWCVKQLLTNCPVWDAGVTSAFGLDGGIQAELTKNQ